jgi:uncharacterized lipoprotein YmbA
MRKLAAVMGLCSAFLLAGCGTSAPITVASYSLSRATQASQAEMQTAIYKALKRRGWHLQSDDGRQIQARYNKQNRHIVDIRIDYSANDFKIHYLSSQGMNFNAKKNTIHRNYNRWVANLERDISSELSFNQ